MKYTSLLFIILIFNIIPYIYEKSVYKRKISEIFSEIFLLTFSLLCAKAVGGINFFFTKKKKLQKEVGELGQLDRLCGLFTLCARHYATGITPWISL